MAGAGAFVEAGEAQPPAEAVLVRLYVRDAPQQSVALHKSLARLALEPSDPNNPLQKWTKAALLGSDTFEFVNSQTGLPITNGQASSLMTDPVYSHPGALGNPTPFEVDGVAEVAAGDDGIPIRVVSNGDAMRKRLSMRPWNSDGNGGAQAPAGGGGCGDDAVFENEEAGGGQGGTDAGPPKRRSKNFLCCCFN